MEFEWEDFSDSEAAYDSFFNLSSPPKLELDYSERSFEVTKQVTNASSSGEERTERSFEANEQLMINTSSGEERTEMSSEENKELVNASSAGQHTDQWTFRENKQFENALAEFDPFSQTFFEDVASRVPTKSIDEIRTHYLALVEDLDMIEAGLIDPPDYNDDQCHSKASKKGKASSSKQQNVTSGEEKRKTTPWTEEEHRMFLKGMEEYGQRDWRCISRYYVPSKTSTQIASHAQKYFRRQKSGTPLDRRRRSIHDIQNVTATTTTTSVSMPPPNHTTIEQTDNQLLPHDSFPLNNITNANNSQQQGHSFPDFHSLTSLPPLTTTSTSLSIPPPITTTTGCISFPPLKDVNLERTKQQLSHGFLSYQTFPPTTTTMTTTTSNLFPPPKDVNLERIKQQISHGFLNYQAFPPPTTTVTNTTSNLFPPPKHVNLERIKQQLSHSFLNYQTFPPTSNLLPPPKDVNLEKIKQRLSHGFDLNYQTFPPTTTTMTTTTSNLFPPPKDENLERIFKQHLSHGSLNYQTFPPTTTTTTTTSNLFPPPKDKSPQITEQPFPFHRLFSYNNRMINNASNNREPSMGRNFVNYHGGSSSSTPLMTPTTFPNPEPTPPNLSFTTNPSSSSLAPPWNRFYYN